MNVFKTKIILLLVSFKLLNFACSPAAGTVTKGALQTLSANSDGVQDGGGSPIGIALDTGVANDLVRILI